MLLSKYSLCVTFSVTGCLSADEVGDCLFLSDSNHHRIIISNYSGEILDSVSELIHIRESLSYLDLFVQEEAF